MNPFNVCVNNVDHGVECGNRAMYDEKSRAKRSSQREVEADLSSELIINSKIEKSS
jgi:hypothetical protein